MQMFSLPRVELWGGAAAPGRVWGGGGCPGQGVVVGREGLPQGRVGVGG